MNAEQLAALGRNAKAFAQTYVALVEELTKLGVVESVARQEARATAAMIALFPENVRKGESCPLCGRTD